VAEGFYQSTWADARAVRGGGNCALRNGATVAIVSRRKNGDAEGTNGAWPTWGGTRVVVAVGAFVARNP